MRNSTTVTTKAIASHESKKMARMGGQSGRKSGEGSRSGFASEVVVVAGIVEVAREVAMPCNAAGGLRYVAIWAVRALVLVLMVMRSVSSVAGAL